MKPRTAGLSNNGRLPGTAGRNVFMRVGSANIRAGQDDRPQYARCYAVRIRLQLGNPNLTIEGPLDTLYALGRRIRNVLTEAELLQIEDEIDDILKVQREKSAGGDENAVDDATLNVAAHRLESLIHDRRTMLGKRPVLVPVA
jgi:hypothetical protein